MAKNKNRRQAARSPRSAGTGRTAEGTADAAPAVVPAPVSAGQDGGAVRNGRTKQRRFGHN